MDLLSYVAGVLLSLAFSYFPGAEKWFKTLDGTQKRLVLLAALSLSAVGLFAWGCAQPGVVTCDTNGALKMFQLLVQAAIASQAVYTATPASAKGA